MALDFAISKIPSRKDKLSYEADKVVSFTDNIRGYLTAFESNFSSGCTLLLTLDEYADTLLYDNKIKQLLLLCVEIQKALIDKGISDKLNPFDLKKEELHLFSSKFSELLQLALDNDKTIVAMGD